MHTNTINIIQIQTFLEFLATKFNFFRTKSEREHEEIQAHGVAELNNKNIHYANLSDPSSLKQMYISEYDVELIKVKVKIKKMLQDLE